LPPDEAAANVSYLRQVLAQKGNANFKKTIRPRALEGLEPAGESGTWLSRGLPPAALIDLPVRLSHPRFPLGAGGDRERIIGGRRRTAARVRAAQCDSGRPQ